MLIPKPEASTRTAGLLTGQVDWIEAPPPDAIARLKSAGIHIVTNVLRSGRQDLMFHPYARIGGHFDETLDGYRGPGNCIWSQEFYETDRSRGFVRGYTFEFSRGQGPVMAAVHGVQIGRLPWGPEHHRAYSKLFCRRTGMVAICEDLPDEHNMVTSDRALKDSNGIPAPKIGGRLAFDGNRAHGNRSGPIRCERVGPQPRREELFIVDGSIFVTSAGVNPTRTIQALALYVADSIKRRLATLFD